MWPLPVLEPELIVVKPYSRYVGEGGAASWGKPAAQGDSVPDDWARRALLFCLSPHTKAMKRPVDFASTKVPLALRKPKAKSWERGYRHVGIRGKPVSEKPTLHALSCD
jgi:hypothetical protein